MPRSKEGSLVLIGGGGHARSVLSSLLTSDRFDRIVIVDASLPKGSLVDGVEVVGDDACLSGLFTQGFRKAFIGVGSVNNTQIRERLWHEVKQLGYEIPPVVDLSAVVATSAIMDEGVYVGKRAVINAGARIHRMAIINTGAIVEHGCRVGEFSHVSVGAVLCGDVAVGSKTLVGANATVIQSLKVGDGCTIGAGSVVLDDVPDGMRALGLWKAGSQ